MIAFYLLNGSVDAPDFFPDYLPEDLTYNEQESIIEIVLEKILGFQDAIPEYDDNDSEKNSTIKKVLTKDIYIVQQLTFQSLPVAENTKINRAGTNTLNRSNPYLEVYSPPPEA